jgi:3',5'-cyclic-AMP phosphodiesterase
MELIVRKLIWLTDMHQNFLPRPQQRAFFQEVADHRPEGIMISGDIGDSKDFANHLIALAECCACPIYFVLGNHDFYHSSFSEVRQVVQDLVRSHPRLHWLSESPPIPLTPDTGLVGHEGWADGRLGNYARSTVVLNDFVHIRDFITLDKWRRLELLNRLGDAAAQHIAAVLPLALEQHRHVILLTHVPPFRDACWHQGALSGDEWLPHMACQATGAAILKCMEPKPDRLLTVLCGHTHTGGEVWLAANVRVVTGAAAYRSPRVTGVIGVL